MCIFIYIKTYIYIYIYSHVIYIYIYLFVFVTLNGLLFSLCDANPIGGNLLTTGDRLCKSYWGGNHTNPIGGEIMQILFGGRILTLKMNY